MILRRIFQFLALVMIGDGVCGLIKPRWHSLLWDVGPEPVHAAVDALVENPTKARFVYLAELAIGIFVATRQTPDVS